MGRPETTKVVEASARTAKEPVPRLPARRRFAAPLLEMKEFLKSNAPEAAERMPAPVPVELACKRLRTQAPIDVKGNEDFVEEDENWTDRAPDLPATDEEEELHEETFVQYQERWQGEMDGETNEEAPPPTSPRPPEAQAPPLLPKEVAVQSTEPAPKEQPQESHTAVLPAEAISSSSTARAFAQVQQSGSSSSAA